MINRCLITKTSYKLLLFSHLLLILVSHYLSVFFSEKTDTFFIPYRSLLHIIFVQKWLFISYAWELCEWKYRSNTRLASRRNYVSVVAVLFVSIAGRCSIRNIAVDHSSSSKARRFQARGNNDPSTFWSLRDPIDSCTVIPQCCQNNIPFCLPICVVE